VSRSMAAKSTGASGALAKAEAALRAHALAKPEATEHFPWGERAIKVKGKVFLFMFADATRLSLSTKLPDSSGVALMLPFAKPTGYGLGKAGWVSASFELASQPPLEMLCAWIDESYQAVAPAKLASLARGADARVTLPANPAKPRATAKPNPRATAKPNPRATAKSTKPRATAKPKPRATAESTKPRATAKPKPRAPSR
jgi:predicted DNA-binding protein (MmcQ/YjbR family)